MSGCRLHDTAALPAALVVPFLVALALVPLRTKLRRRTRHWSSSSPWSRLLPSAAGLSHRG
ncbi:MULTISPECIES: hypothetical protein [unclassified Streptomyces]|uniref:hypothetical protein n=1 Tax=unclassified Streptomyces TaxID=2593676 RepID=UPI0004CC2BE6|nr:hypothetical protein [Streptomyces sp. NRRL F-2747]